MWQWWRVRFEGLATLLSPNQYWSPLHCVLQSTAEWLSWEVKDALWMQSVCQRDNVKAQQKWHPWKKFHSLGISRWDLEGSEFVERRNALFRHTSCLFREHRTYLMLLESCRVVWRQQTANRSSGRSAAWCRVPFIGEKDWSRWLWERDRFSSSSARLETKHSLPSFLNRRSGTKSAMETVSCLASTKNHPRTRGNWKPRLEQIELCNQIWFPFTRYLEYHVLARWPWSNPV